MSERCYNCQKYGHKARDCSESITDIKLLAKVKERKERCHECGQSGHKKRDCPQKNKNKKNILSKKKTCFLCYNDSYLSYFFGNTHSNKNCPHQNRKLLNVNYLKELISRDITLIYDYNGKECITRGYIQNDEIFKISEINNDVERALNGKWFSKVVKKISRIPIFKKIIYTTIPKSFKIYDNIDNIMCRNWYFINMELSRLGKIKHTYVAEDKRSGSNLLKYLEIDGKPVEHNAHRDCIVGTNCGEFYISISNLFRETLAPRNALMATLTLIKIRYFRQTILSQVPKDVVKIIGKKIIDTRNEKCWALDKFEHLKHDMRIVNLC